MELIINSASYFLVVSREELNEFLSGKKRALFSDNVKHVKEPSETNRVALILKDDFDG